MLSERAASREARPPASGKIWALNFSQLDTADTIVEPIYLFDLAASQARWLAVRQAAVAENVANANTPGYTAKDVAPFGDVYAQTQLQLASTNPAHFSNDPSDLASATSNDDSPWEVTPSGNSVSMEHEMLKANKVNRDYSMNTAIVKAFHQMMSLGLKGAT